MDISALEAMNADVLTAILVFFALLSFILFCINIKLGNNISELKSFIDEKFKSLEKKTLKKDPSSSSDSRVEMEKPKDTIGELEALQKQLGLE